MTMIKAITLRQPWGSLAISGLKEYETRSFQPWKNMRGALLGIHAGYSFEDEERLYWRRFVRKYPEVKALFADEHSLARIPPRKMMLGVCKLVDWYPTAALVDQISDRELDFGNWSPGRWAWQLQVVDLFDTPVPASGNQGFWDWNYVAG